MTLHIATDKRLVLHPHEYINNQVFLFSFTELTVDQDPSSGMGIQGIFGGIYKTMIIPHSDGWRKN